MFQTKEQDKTPKTDLNKTEMSDLYHKEFKIMGHKYVHQSQENNE